MKANMTRIKWDKEDIRLFEYALKIMLDNIEAAAIDKEDYESAYNQGIDHIIEQLKYYREE